MSKLNIERIAIELYGIDYKAVISGATIMDIEKIQQSLEIKALQTVRSDNDLGVDIKEKLYQVKRDVTDFMNACRG